MKLSDQRPSTNIARRYSSLDPLGLTRSLNDMNTVPNQSAEPYDANSRIGPGMSPIQPKHDVPTVRSQPYITEQTNGARKGPKGKWFGQKNKQWDKEFTPMVLEKKKK